MAATIKLTRTSGMEPGIMRPLQVLLDGKKAAPIRAGETKLYPVTPGAHGVRVKQDLSASLELKVSVEEGAAVSLECGCQVRGWWTPIFILWWAWRVFVPGKLFYLKRKPGR